LQPSLSTLDRYDPADPVWAAWVDRTYSLPPATGPRSDVHMLGQIAAIPFESMGPAWQLEEAEGLTYLQEHSEAVREEARARLDGLLARLPDCDREVLTPSWDGALQSDIAEALGISQPAVCRRIGNALERLALTPKLPDIKPESLIARLFAHGLDRTTAAVAATFYYCPSGVGVSLATGVPERSVTNHLAAADEVLQQKWWTTLRTEWRPTRRSHGSSGTYAWRGGAAREAEVLPWIRKALEA